jgi:uncharacterized membrane protein
MPSLDLALGYHYALRDYHESNSMKKHQRRQRWIIVRLGHLPNKFLYFYIPKIILVIYALLFYIYFTEDACSLREKSGIIKNK